MIDQLLQRTGDAIYARVADLEIAGWLTAEPVPFADRRRGRPITPRVGEPWAGHLFDCAWMRFTAVLPPDAAQGDPLVARIDLAGELCLVDDTGVPVRGLTSVKSSYDVRLGSPAKTVYRLPAALVAQGRVELWGDAANNDLFGVVQGEGRVVCAEIARCREDVRDLYYDLETLRHALVDAVLPPARAGELEADLAAVARELDCRDRDSVARARRRLAPWFASPDKPALHVHAVGHAHMDLAWLWPIRETIRKGARTFASVLHNLERFPEYVFGASQPQLYAWMKEHYPELYARIRREVARGRIEPQGVFWVEVDCNIPNGESFVRQILHGTRFFREEFGVEPRYCWEPDVFGYHGQLPQILRRSGVPVFMTQKISWNVVNRFPLQSFHWEGIDGTPILAHLLPEETYNGPASAISLKKIRDDYAQKDVSNHALMVFGIGDGGGGPDAEHLERLRRAPGLPGLPAVSVRPAAEFFSALGQEAHRFPRYRGELYLERHQGTLTTQARMKRFNRTAERTLREIEWIACLAARHAGVPVPTAELDQIWKEVLLYQFHDILPGSSIKRVYEECYARYAQLLARMGELRDERYAAVAARGGPAAAVAFNSLSWLRTDWLKVDGAWHHVTVPALGCAALPPPQVTSEVLRADRTGLENSRLRVTLAAQGFISSIRDRRTGREYVAAGEFANAFVVIADKGDAWDFESDFDKKDVWLYLARPVVHPVLQSTEAAVDGPCASVIQTWRVDQSVIRQTLRLMAGSDRIVFDTQVDWQETASMLRVRFPVAVQADTARFEIPFGHLRRSTREVDSVERAQIEVAAQQWVDLSQANAGVALLNDCKYGHRVKGHTLDLCLIRSVPHPNIATAGRPQEAGQPREIFTDLGAHEFKYALLPHDGPGDVAYLTQAARELNAPLPVVRAAGATGAMASLPPAPFRLSSPAIELAVLKPAEAGGGWVLRLVNLTEHTVTADLALADARGALTECDLMERVAADARPIPAGVARLEFGPFEIKSLLWHPPPAAAGG